MSTTAQSKKSNKNISKSTDESQTGLVYGNFYLCCGASFYTESSDHVTFEEYLEEMEYDPDEIKEIVKDKDSDLYDEYQDAYARVEKRNADFMNPRAFNITKPGAKTYELSKKLALFTVPLKDGYELHISGCCGKDEELKEWL